MCNIRILERAAFRLPKSQLISWIYTVQCRLQIFQVSHRILVCIIRLIDSSKRASQAFVSMQILRWKTYNVSLHIRLTLLRLKFLGKFLALFLTPIILNDKHKRLWMRRTKKNIFSVYNQDFLTTTNWKFWM